MTILDLVKKAKGKSSDAIEELVNKFMPLIDMYTRKMDYDEDFKSSMILKFIELIQNDLPIGSLKMSNDGAVVKYIATSMKNHYILLSKLRTKMLSNECPVYDNAKIKSSYDANNETDTVILKLCLESILTPTEAKYIHMIFFQGYTSVEVASLYGVSRQAVNQCKINALRKVKYSLFMEQSLTFANKLGKYAVKW